MLFAPCFSTSPLSKIQSPPPLPPTPGSESAPGQTQYSGDEDEIRQIKRSPDGDEIRQTQRTDGALTDQLVIDGHRLLLSARRLAHRAVVGAGISQLHGRQPQRAVVRRGDARSFAHHPARLVRPAVAAAGVRRQAHAGLQARYIHTRSHDREHCRRREEKIEMKTLFRVAIRLRITGRDRDENFI